jgi:hypothetical protein
LLDLAQEISLSSVVANSGLAEDTTTNVPSIKLIGTPTTGKSLANLAISVVKVGTEDFSTEGTGAASRIEPSLLLGRCVASNITSVVTPTS